MKQKQHRHEYDLTILKKIRRWYKTNGYPLAAQKAFNIVQDRSRIAKNHRGDIALAEDLGIET